jgi:hypothetical protein
MHFAELSTEAALAVADPRHITRSELRRLGLPHLVYLRSGLVDGQQAYAIHAADGTAMAVVEDVEGAIELAAANDMTFVAVH